MYCIKTTLRGLDTLSRISDILFKEDKFCDFLFASLQGKHSSEKES